MRNPFRRMFSSLGAFLVSIHFIGAIVSFVVFSYQYAVRHSFMSWLAFGEIVPAMKSFAWEVFLVLALVQGSTQSPAVVSATQDFWWSPEYPALVRAIDAAPRRLLATSYKSGSQGEREIRLFLFMVPDGALVLRTELPPGSMFTIDPETGKEIPGTVSTVLTIRDHDLDGTLDDFHFKLGDVGMQPDPSSGEEVTSDGFVKFKDDPDHQFVLVKWVIGIGFCINHFLHGVDSALPRD